MWENLNNFLNVSSPSHFISFVPNPCNHQEIGIQVNIFSSIMYWAKNRGLQWSTLRKVVVSGRMHPVDWYKAVKGDCPPEATVHEPTIQREPSFVFRTKNQRAACMVLCHKDDRLFTLYQHKAGHINSSVP